jgi:hypothetical protein
MRSPSRALALLLMCFAAAGSAGCSAETEDPAAADDVDSEESEVARKTTLTFFLVGKEYSEKTKEWKKVSLDSLNADLEKKGLPTFHKAITVGRADGKKFQAILDQLAEANKQLKREIELEETWDPSEYKGLCFNGSSSGVMKTVEGLRGSAFSEYMGVQAYRYGSRKKVWNSTEEEWLRMQKEDNGHADTVKAWEKFDGKSGDFLMMTDGGQQGDGTELFAVTIPKCK